MTQRSFTEDPLFRRIRKHASQRLEAHTSNDRKERVKGYKRFLELEKKMLRRYHRNGDSGIRVSRSFSIIMDVLIENVFVDALEELKEKHPKSPCAVSVIATGGYGRGELCPHSDIDLLMLYPDKLSGKQSKEFQSDLTEAMLYPLWDLGMKVGHATRNLKETITEAKAEVKSKNAIMDARLIVGGQKLYGKFYKGIQKFLRKEDAQEYLQDRFRSQSERRQQQGDTVTVQEPDIKNGVGGLRDYQNLQWMCRIKFGSFELKELQQRGIITRAQLKKLETAYSFLLRVRNEIHFRSKRATDQLLLDSQPLVAWNLGYRQRKIIHRVETFMRDYYKQAHLIYKFSKYLEGLLVQTDLPGRAPLSFRDVVRAHQQAHERQPRFDGFIIRDGKIAAERKSVFKEDPERLIRIFRHVQQYQTELDFDLKLLIETSLPLIDRHVIESSSANASFRAILQTAGEVYPALTKMNETGVLAKFMPEWEKMYCLVQHEYYHRYTADTHTLRTIRELDIIFTSRDRESNTYRDALRETQFPRLLYLILLLHDIGKGIAIRNHAINGVAIAAPILERMEVPGEMREQILFIIQNHLEMARFSQRYDLDDPRTAESFAEFVGDPDKLAYLFVHTYCDARGTAEGLWNGFKDGLHSRLYRDTLRVLKNKSAFAKENRERKMIVYNEIREKHFDDISRDEIEAHFSLLPERYFLHHSAREVELHIRMIHSLLTNIQEADSLGSLVPVIDWENDQDRSMTVVNVVTWDRAGLFYKLAGAFALAGLNIISSKAISRTDHITIDTFYVVVPGGGAVTDDRPRKIFEEAVTHALLHNKNLLPEINEQARKIEAKKRKSYKSTEQLEAPITPRVEVFHELSLRRTIIEVKANDRLGLLYELTRSLYESGFDITFARISTERGVAIDTFYIESVNPGQKTDTSNLLTLRESLNDLVVSRESHQAADAS